MSSFLLNHQFGLRLIGSGFLCYLGLKIFLTPPAQNSANAKDSGLVGAYASIFFLTLTNPMTIFSFAAIFMGLGIMNTKANYLSAGILVLGVFIGSALWWLFLSISVGLFRGSFTPARLRWVNRISGLLIIGFGCLVLVECLGSVR